MGEKRKYDIEAIYKAYYRDVYRYVLLMNYQKTGTEDIVQNTFLRAMESLDKFRGESDIKTWLFAIARNESIRYSGMERRHVGLEYEVPVQSVSLSERCLEKEDAETVLHYIQKCREPKKSLMILRLLDELSFVEIGRVIGKSDTWCRVTFLRAKNEIIQRLEDGK